MLVIRKAQLEALGQHRQTEFQRRLRVHLQAVLDQAGRTLGDRDIDREIVAGLQRSREYGIEREADIAGFLEAVLLHLGGFDGLQFPRPALSVLYGYRTQPAVKIERFREWCRTRADEANIQ